MRTPLLASLFALAAFFAGLAQAQETERLGAPPIVWAVPRLQLFSPEGKDFFSGLDAAIALPLTPRTNIAAIWTFDLHTKDVATATFNYDMPLGKQTTARGLIGVLEDRFGVGFALHRDFGAFGIGLFTQHVEGDWEGGLMLTRPVNWGFKLTRPASLRRREETGFASGAGSLGTLGARAAVIYRSEAAGTRALTSAVYFPSYQQAWPREGHSAQGLSYTPSEFPPPVRPAWRYQAEGPIRTSAAIVEGVAYVGSDDGWLYALALRSGQRLWRFPAESPITSAPAWAEGRLYFGTDRGDLCCVEPPAAGAAPAARLIWRYRAAAAFTASPLVTDKGLVIAGAADGQIYAVDRTKGRLVWKLATGGPVLAPATKISRSIPGRILPTGTPTRLTPGVLVGSTDGKLYAIEEVRGHVLWTFATDGPITGAAAILGSCAVVANRKGTVYALEAETGRQLWKADLGAPVAFGPALDEGRVYVATTEGMICALELATGQRVWQTDLQSPAAASPTLVAKGMLYVPTREGRLWTLDTASGNVLSVLCENAPLSSAAAVAEEHLIIGSEIGAVFAYLPGKGSRAKAAQERPRPEAMPSDTPSPMKADGTTSDATVEATPSPTSQPSGPGAKATVNETPTAAGTENLAPNGPVPVAKPERLPALHDFPSPVTPPVAPVPSEAPRVQPSAPPPQPPAASASGTAYSLSPAPSTAAPAAPLARSNTQPVDERALPKGDASTALPLLTLLITPPDEQPPLLLANQPTLLVGGKIAPTAGIRAVRLNGQEVPIRNGEYQTTLTYPGPGQYLLLIEAQDQNGQWASYRRIVHILEGREASGAEPITLSHLQEAPGLRLSAGLRAAEAGIYRKTVEIRNERGQLVHNWVGEGDKPLEIVWRGTNANGTPLPPGEYEIIYIVSGAEGPVASLRQKIFWQS